ncbi:hypothetical protein LSAT2_030645 [Lamellibrachia satsuma]|nr:hypothetical protein LSAT2_030645 [Lamellibrachia satsuma]
MQFILLFMLFSRAFGAPLRDAIIDDLPVILDDTTTQDEQITTYVKSVTDVDVPVTRGRSGPFQRDMGIDAIIGDPPVILDDTTTQDEQITTYVKSVTDVDVPVTRGRSGPFQRDMGIDAIIDDLPVILDDTTTQDEPITTYVKPVTDVDVPVTLVRSSPFQRAERTDSTIDDLPVILDDTTTQDEQITTYVKPVTDVDVPVTRGRSDPFQRAVRMDPMLTPPGFHLVLYVVAVFLFLFVVALGVVWCYATAPREPSLEESKPARNSDHDHLLSVSSYATHLNTMVCQMKDRPKRRSAVVRFVRYITFRKEQIFPHGISSTSLQIERSELLSSGWLRSLEALPAGCEHPSRARCVDLCNWEEGESSSGDF